MMIKTLNGADPDNRVFELDRELLLLTNNCLNEVLHGFPVTGIEDILRMSREDAERLLDRVNTNVDSGQGVVVSKCELAAIAKCISLTIAELGPEFSIRTGFQLESAGECEKEISAAISEASTPR